jgi:hypothetical protein
MKTSSCFIKPLTWFLLKLSFISFLQFSSLATFAGHEIAKELNLSDYNINIHYRNLLKNACDCRNDNTFIYVDTVKFGTERYYHKETLSPKTQAGEFTISPGPNTSKTYYLTANYTGMQKWGYTCMWPDKCNRQVKFDEPYKLETVRIKPPNNVKASDSISDSYIEITWEKGTDIPDSLHQYKIYRDTTLIATLAGDVRKYIDTKRPSGMKYSYTIETYTEGWGGHTSVRSNADYGSTWDLNFSASKSLTGKVSLFWKPLGNYFNGFLITRRDSIDSDKRIAISDIKNGLASGVEDANTVPGYTYEYCITPYSENSNTICAEGKSKPDGVIRGKVATATSADGIGVPINGIKVIAELNANIPQAIKGSRYSAITNAKGEYEINDIYYYNNAVFNVYVDTTSKGNITPEYIQVGLTSNEKIKQDVNFTDNSSYVISGRISHDNCPIPGVVVSAGNASATTDSSGNYNITIASGGSYKIKPSLAGFVFEPESKDVIIASNVAGVDFQSKTFREIYGSITGPCGISIGSATLRLISKKDTKDTCNVIEIKTNPAGVFSATVPALKYLLNVSDFKSSDENIVKKEEILAYFDKVMIIDLSLADSSSNNNDSIHIELVFRRKPKFTASNLGYASTCSNSGSSPVFMQFNEYKIQFKAEEVFGTSRCLIKKGFVVVKQNITSNNMSIAIDTVNFNENGVAEYKMIAGAPNLIEPHQKYFEAVLVVDSHKDTIHSRPVVLGYMPREETFVTVTPEMPFLVLHRPPGDASYSYIEKSQSISNSISESVLLENDLEVYTRVQLGRTISHEIGFIKSVSIEINAQLDITGTVAAGISELVESSIQVTTTATERFQTSDNPSITGTSGDVFVGGAMNMRYSIADVLRYDFDNCKFLLTKTIVMDPAGLSTTFIYTESHIRNSIIPELAQLASIQRQQGNETKASYFNNQISVWRQVVEKNKENIESARFIENKSFSGGVSYEYSLETSTTKSITYEYETYIDEGVAIEAGLSVAGIGAFGGVSVKSRRTIGQTNTNEVSKSNTVGFVLSDDDIGDSFSVNILNNSVYGVPAFKLAAGKSSCPWEPGTLPREGVQLSSSSYTRTIREGLPAVFNLQLGNLSQSDEDRVYNLLFDHTSNPNGAVIKIGGSPAVGNIPYPYTIKAGKNAEVTVSLEKAPEGPMSYRNIRFVLESPCDENIYDEIYLNAEFFREHELNLSFTGEGGKANLKPGIHRLKEGQHLLYASAEKGYEFVKWVVDGKDISRAGIAVDLESNIAITGVFRQSAEPQVMVTVANGGGGTVEPISGDHFYSKNKLVSFNALADDSKIFDRWIIDGKLFFSPNVELEASSDIYAIAYFKDLPVEYNIDLLVYGNGFTDIPEGKSSISDENLVLFAAAQEGYIFEKWIINGIEHTSNPISLKLSEDSKIELYFARAHSAQHKLSINLKGLGIVSPAAGSSFYSQDALVPLKAEAMPGHKFIKWEIDGQFYYDQTISLKIEKSISAIAYFEQDTTARYHVEIVCGNGGLSVPNPGIYNHLSTEMVSINAIPEDGYNFSHWIINGRINKNLAVNVPVKSDILIQAFFAKDEDLPLYSDGNKTEKQYMKAFVELVPNPASKSVNVHTNSPIVKLSVSKIETGITLISRYVPQTFNAFLDVSSLPSGLYILIVETEEFTKTIQLIIER